ncbi:MAG: iron complex outerrane recepter protein, partial [Sphingomonadales bacterium]|nr:iron complex outerrane recepter protein [Sphingomonadales bacterium]
MKTYALPFAIAALVAAPAAAQETEAQEPETAAAAARDHGDHDVQEGAIVVTGIRRKREDVLSGTSVMTGATLAENLRPTIGETLASLPGVSATSFGPNASRPVLRGFQGERVRVLTDGIGSLDVSNTSADHAVAINPLTADRIEVLRGPAALLFGSSAIGGVVNVIDARIPRRIPDEAVHAQGIATYGSAADERSVNGLLDVPLGGGFVAHFDGNHGRTDDLRIGGYLLSPELRRQALASPDSEVRALAALRGHLPNTAARTSDLAAGIAWINGDSSVGASVNRYASLYGVPIRFSLDPAAEAEAPRIDVRQTRADVRAEIGAGNGFIDSVRLRGAYSDYRHDELEEDGAVGTTFFNQGYEGRLELVQGTSHGFGGAFGAQYFQRSLDVVGDEKFLPPNRTWQLGLFALESFVSGPLRAEAGLRYERQSVRADADADLGNPALERAFDSVSGSIGGSYSFGTAFRIGLNLSHTERAPAAEELFANGPHAGTQSFEIGDPNLRGERSWGAEITLHAHGEGYEIGASLFQSWFRNYIYERATGEVMDDLPVFRISQANARYAGIEFEASATAAHVGGFAINLDAVGDYIRATIHGSGPVPRIPPLRLLGGIEAQSDSL